MSPWLAGKCRGLGSPSTITVLYCTVLYFVPCVQRRNRAATSLDAAASQLTLVFDINASVVLHRLPQNCTLEPTHTLQSLLSSCNHYHYLYITIMSTPAVL